MRVPFLLLCLPLFSGGIEGRVITVPDDVPTVQSGLDEIGEGDTLFVHIGVYPENLQAPPFEFVMLGELSDDSTGYSRPLIDPTILETPDSTPVFRFPDNSIAMVKNFEFQNVGRKGIVCTGRGLTLENCAVYSTVDGLVFDRDSLDALVSIKNCIFWGNTDYTVRISRGNRLRAIGSTFVGGGTDRSRSMVVSSESTIDSCYFTSEGSAGLLYCWSGNHVVTNCTFGPAVARSIWDESMVDMGNSTIRFSDNVFVDCVYSRSVLEFQVAIGDSAEIVNNSFTHCIGADSLLTPRGIVYIEQGNAEGRGILVGGNTFTECSSNQTVDDIFVVPFFPALIENNRFIRDAQNGLPSIRSGSPFQPSPLTLRNNVWEDCGYAASLYPPADARSNYWGDPSGPYHEFENPGGLGDTVTGSMLFVPWLEDTVTSVEDRSPEVIEEFSIRAFPNPFNSRVTIEFTTARLQEMELKIFDIQGRLVADLLNETRSSGSYTIEWDALATASGTYFARLTGNSVWSASKVIKLALIK